MSGADGMEDGEQNNEIIRLIEKLDEEQTKNIIEYLHRLMGLTA